ncbi:MAG: hypothetical protein JST82_13465 [Bacteroidetes bacterium]|nr:hypothetical protein [Bacteroidota bacterium]
MSIVDRIDIAVALLKEGKSFPVDDILLRMVATDIVGVTGFTSYNIFEHLNQSNVLEDLQNLKLQFQDMVKASTVLKDYIIGKEIQFFINFDMYGKSSMSVCSEIKGEIFWIITLMD